MKLVPSNFITRAKIERIKIMLKNFRRITKKTTEEANQELLGSRELFSFTVYKSESVISAGAITKHKNLVELATKTCIKREETREEDIESLIYRRESELFRDSDRYADLELFIEYEDGRKVGNFELFMDGTGYKYNMFELSGGKVRRPEESFIVNPDKEFDKLRNTGIFEDFKTFLRHSYIVNTKYTRDELRELMYNKEEETILYYCGRDNQGYMFFEIG